MNPDTPDTPDATPTLASFERELRALDLQISQLTAYRGTLAHTVRLYRQGRQAAAVLAFAPPADAAPTSVEPHVLDMAKTVIRNAGRPLTLAEMRTTIKQTYGLDPTPTFESLVYKAAQRTRGFYRTEGGKYGVVEERNGVTIVSVPMTTTMLV